MPAHPNARADSPTFRLSHPSRPTDPPYPHPLPTSTSAHDPQSYTIVSHPVLKHKLTQLRDASTPPAEFRRLVKEISTILGVKASETLALKDVPGVSAHPPLILRSHEMRALRSGAVWAGRWVLSARRCGAYRSTPSPKGGSRGDVHRG